MLTILLSLAAGAARADDSLLKNRPSAVVAGRPFALEARDGDHFNLDAPQKCGGAAPLSKSAREIVCRVDAPGRADILLTLCDDALTFCRRETFSVEVSPGAASSAAPASAPPKAARSGETPPGFIDNDPAAAFARARRIGAPVFVDFYGIWCPPCNDLAEYAYPDPAFRSASKGWIKLALDADDARSFALKDRWRVGGYPTLIAADARGREIDRLVGFASGPALAEFLIKAKSDAALPAREAAKRLESLGASAPENLRLRVARWLAARGEPARAEAVLAPDASPAARKLLLETRLDAAHGDDSAKEAALLQLVRAFPDDASYADWVESLSEIDTAPVAGLLPALKTSVARWVGDPRLSDHGDDPGDLLYDEASVLDALGRKDEARAEFSAAADAYAAQAARSPLKTPRAANFGRADSLLKAGRRAEAEALYALLLKAYPREFTFNYDYASALADGGDLARALPYARAAASVGYGDNRLRAARLVGEVLLGLGRIDEAGKIVDDALTTPAPTQAHVRTGRYLDALRALKKKIDAARRPG